MDWRFGDSSLYFAMLLQWSLTWYNHVLGDIDPVHLEAVMEQAFTRAIEFDLNRKEIRARFNQLRV